MDRIETLEERVAHLLRAVDDLSDRVHAQGGEIDRLTRRMALLLEREAEREAAVQGTGDPDQRPPHW